MNLSVAYETLEYLDVFSRSPKLSKAQVYTMYMSCWTISRTVKSTILMQAKGDDGYASP